MHNYDVVASMNLHLLPIFMLLRRSLNTCINWLQSKSMKSFVEKLQACLKDHTEDKIDIKSRMETIQTKMRTSKFTTSDLQKIIRIY